MGGSPRNAKTGGALPSDELGSARRSWSLAAQMLANPARLAESQMNLWWDYMNLWQTSMLRMMGAAAEPVAVPAKGDKRFKHGTGSSTSCSTTSSSPT